MEAYSESIIKMDNLTDRRVLVRDFVSSQGDSKGVKEYLKSLAKAARASSAQSQAEDAEDFLKAFQGGFKGID